MLSCLLHQPQCHYAMKLENELFPTVVIVDIPFPIDRRELFSTVSAAVGICSLNISLRSEEKGMSTLTTIGKSSFSNFMAQCIGGQTKTKHLISEWGYHFWGATRNGSPNFSRVICLHQSGWFWNSLMLWLFDW